MLKLSEYSESLPKLAKERYKQKLEEIKCSVDPYIADSYSFGPAPVVSYTNIYDFLICSSNGPSCDGKPANAFKSLDGFRMVCAEGWMSTLQTKVWADAVVIKGEVKPSQQSGVLYKTWVAVKKSGEVISGHCTCMAGLSEVCNHVGAVLYKCMHDAQQPLSSTSLPNQWLPARKVVPPVPVKDVNFALTKVRKCQSTLEPPKHLKHSTKTASNLDLRDLSENDQEEFYTKLSSQLDYHPNILSIHHKFNKPFLPVSQTVQLPPTITSLFSPAKTKLSYDELVIAAENVKASYIVTDEESKNLEEATRLQARCKLWEVYRAGRVTASNLRATVHTDTINPSKSLIKRICYPEACKFVSSATTWGCQH